MITLVLTQEEADYLRQLLEREVATAPPEKASCAQRLRDDLPAGPPLGELATVSLLVGVNDSLEHIEATAQFLIRLGRNAAKLEIMPFHRMGKNKYRALNMVYTMEGLEAADDGKAEAARNAYIQCGIECSISR